VRFLNLLPGLLLGVVMALVTGMWQFALFTFVSVLSVALTTALVKRKKREPDLDFSDQPIWLSSWAVAIGDKVLPRTGWFFKEQYSEIFFDHATKLAAEREVYERSRELEATHYRTTGEGLLPFWAGVADSLDLEFDLAKDGPHALIVGSTGAGKSEFLKLITGSMLVSVKEPFELALIDFKGGAGLRDLNRHPWTLTMITDLDKQRQERFWQYLAGELRTRELQLSLDQISSISESKTLKRMLVLADELPAIITSHPLALPTLEAIAARGRSLGVHLIATSQSLAGIPRALITNLNLRFAIGVTDPGDLISLVPSMRATASAPARALAVFGNSTAWFDFPMSKGLPKLDEKKVDEDKVQSWTRGLPIEFESSDGVYAVMDIPTEHQFKALAIQSLMGTSVLIVGAGKSGKSNALEVMGELSGMKVLDSPTVNEIEKAFQEQLFVWCAISSSTLLPISIQRRFENIIYLRQSNLDQHLAAGLPKGAWHEELPPGRGWYRGLAIQFAKPAQKTWPSNSVREPEQLVR